MIIGYEREIQAQEMAEGMAEFLKKTGFLTPKQRVVVRKKLVKYNKQLVRLANA